MRNDIGDMRLTIECLEWGRKCFLDIFDNKFINVIIKKEELMSILVLSEMGEKPIHTTTNYFYFRKMPGGLVLMKNGDQISEPLCRKEAAMLLDMKINRLLIMSDQHQRLYDEIAEA